MEMMIDALAGTLNQRCDGQGRACESQVFSLKSTAL